MENFDIIKKYPHAALELSKVRRMREDEQNSPEAILQYIKASRFYNELRLGPEAAESLYKLELDDCYYYFIEKLLPRLLKLESGALYGKSALI